MKVVAIVQARMGSTRLPNKVMKPIGDVPMIELLLARLAKSKEIDQIVLATSTDERNTPLVEHVQTLGYTCIRGSESDVLDRYLVAARQVQADIIVRITGDCPLIDAELVDQAIQSFKSANVDTFAKLSGELHVDSRAFSQCTGWRPPVTLSQGLLETAAAHRQAP